jgi:hypothetical protein
MDTLQDVMSDIRVFLYGGMLTLPLTLAGTMSILGLFTANYALLFFLLGYLIATPLVAWCLNYAVSSTGATWLTTTRADTCKVYMPYTTFSKPSPAVAEVILCSEWMSMISFFIGYMINNSLTMYSRDATNASDAVPKVMNRTSQALIALISTIVFAVVVVWFRYNNGCETKWSLLITLAAFGNAGWWWYTMLSSIGQDRLSDLFGIANRLLPDSALKPKPVACVPIPN